MPFGIFISWGVSGVAVPSAPLMLERHSESSRHPWGPRFRFVDFWILFFTKQNCVCIIFHLLVWDVQ
jgi:hypothetical protein